MERDRTKSKRGGRRPGTASRDRRKLRILLADDSPVTRELVARLLETKNHTVVATENGRQALAALGKGPFDLVILDLHMPVLNGIETTAAIRKREQGTPVPIIALTSDDTAIDEAHCREIGINTYLSKPVWADQLFETIESLISSGDRQTDGLSAEGILDASALLDRVRGNVETLKRMIELFLYDCPSLLSGIKKAVDSQDAAELRSAAHALKGAVSNFDAWDAVEAARKLEFMALEGDLSRADEVYKTLDRELVRVKRALLNVHSEVGRTSGRRGGEHNAQNPDRRG